MENLICHYQLLLEGMRRLLTKNTTCIMLNNKFDGGAGGGGEMENRVTRLETMYELQQKTLTEIRDDLRSTRNELVGFERASRSDINQLEKRVIDKVEENHKWVVGLIISSIIVPLLIALVTK